MQVTKKLVALARYCMPGTWCSGQVIAGPAEKELLNESHCQEMVASITSQTFTGI